MIIADYFLVVRLAQYYIVDALFNIGKNSNKHLLRLITGVSKEDKHKEEKKNFEGEEEETFVNPLLHLSHYQQVFMDKEPIWPLFFIHLLITPNAELIMEPSKEKLLSTMKNISDEFVATLDAVPQLSTSVSKWKEICLTLL